MAAKQKDTGDRLLRRQFADNFVRGKEKG